MGQAAFARDHYGDAVRAYEAALATDRNAIDAPGTLYKLGLAYIRHHNWVEGRRRLRELTEQHAGSPQADYARDILSTPRDGFHLKCASFATTRALQRQMDKLRNMGLSPTAVPITREGRTLQSVQVGDYRTFAEARAAGDRLLGRGVSCFVFP
jgi:hypothetical protein